MHNYKEILNNYLHDAPPNCFRIALHRWQEVRGILRNTALWDAEHPQPAGAQHKTKWVARNEFEAEDGVLYKKPSARNHRDIDVNSLPWPSLREVVKMSSNTIPDVRCQYTANCATHSCPRVHPELACTTHCHPKQRTSFCCIRVRWSLERMVKRILRWRAPSKQ